MLFVSSKFYEMIINLLQIESVFTICYVAWNRASFLAFWVIFFFVRRREKSSYANICHRNKHVRAPCNSQVSHFRWNSFNAWNDIRYRWKNGIIKQPRRTTTNNSISSVGEISAAEPRKRSRFDNETRGAIKIFFFLNINPCYFLCKTRALENQQIRRRWSRPYRLVIIDEPVY